MRSRSANLAGTQMACINIGEIDRTFRDALKRATRVTAAADRLQVSDATGTRLAVFAARVHGQPTMAGLTGTSWQLVKFQGGDGATLTPDERSTYTIEFDDGGRLTARIDCNRGRGTWKSSGPNQLQFGALGLTRAKCPPGSMHDQIVKQCAFQHRVYLRRKAFERRLEVFVMVLGLTPARRL